MGGYICSPDTIEALQRLYNRYGSYGIICKMLHMDKNQRPTLRGIIVREPGACSRTYENNLRERMGLSQLVLPYQVDPCLDCGGLHVLERCRHKVGEMRIVAPIGKRNDKRAHRASISVSPSVWDELNSLRGEQPWNDFLLGLLVAYRTAPVADGVMG